LWVRRFAVSKGSDLVPGLFSCVPSMFDSLEVQILYPT
jgi:hypothetical protein